MSIGRVRRRERARVGGRWRRDDMSCSRRCEPAFGGRPHQERYRPAGRIRPLWWRSTLRPPAR